MVTRKEIDLVAAWSVDRIGRSLQDLLTFLIELRSKEVDLYLHTQGLDTSTPAGRAMYQMLGVFSEFERAMIQERVKSGMARAKAEGKILGRPKLSEKTFQEVRNLNEQGIPKLQISKQLKISRQKVYDALILQ